MELASMLAGEPFTDRPESVCPVIAEFLRTYNDEVDDKRRRELYVYASQSVGTRGGHDVERLRANMCLRWWTRYHRPRRRLMRIALWGLAPAASARDTEIAYRAARFAAASRDLHASALALLDDLVSVGRRAPGAPTGPPTPVETPAAASAPGGLGLRATCARSKSPI
jgi:hypothetical protein